MGNSFGGRWLYCQPARAVQVRGHLLLPAPGAPMALLVLPWEGRNMLWGGYLAAASACASRPCAVHRHGHHLLPAAGALIALLAFPGKSFDVLWGCPQAVLALTPTTRRSSYAGAPSAPCHRRACRNGCSICARCALWHSKCSLKYSKGHSSGMILHVLVEAGAESQGELVICWQLDAACHQPGLLNKAMHVAGGGGLRGGTGQRDRGAGQPPVPGPHPARPAGGPHQAHPRLHQRPRRAPSCLTVSA